MNGVVYVIDSYKVICFMDNRFPEINVDVLSSKAVFTVLVFFDQHELLTCCNQMDAFPGHLDICLVGCASSGILDYLEKIQQSGRIRNVYISIADVYSVLAYNNVRLGMEKWDNEGTPDGLCPLDQSILKIDDIHKLLPSLENIVDEILEFRPENDLEKIVLVDLWFQRNVQYIKAKETYSLEGVYLCEKMNREALVEDIILRRFGVCTDIAFTAAMILNHPRINVPCRQVSAERNGFNHSWNIVTCDGADYYTDFTHNITRNPDKVSYALKARSYCHQYTLLGLAESFEEYGSTTVYQNSRLSPSCYARDRIEEVCNRFIFRGIPLRWDDCLIMDSVFLPKELKT